MLSPASDWAPESPARVVSAPLPGRARLAVCGLQRNPRRAQVVEDALRDRAGVRAVEASARTGNVLVVFDPSRCALDDLVAGVAEAIGHVPSPTTADSVRQVVVRSDTPGRLRLAVLGLRGHPEREATVAAAIAALPGGRAVTASAPTGTVLV